MQDIDQAHRVLGLPKDADLAQAEEAHRDLLEVWDPDRFEGDSRLREKAVRKLAEVNEALETIRAHAARALAAKSAADDQSPSQPPGRLPRNGRTKASLYDDIFAKTDDTEEKAFPTWIIVLVSVLVLALILLFTIPFSDSESALIVIPEPVTQEAAPASDEEVDSTVADGVEESTESSPEKQVAQSDIVQAAPPKEEPPARPSVPPAAAVPAEPVVRRKPSPPPPEPAPAESRPRLNRRPAKAASPEPVQTEEVVEPEEPAVAAPSQAARNAFELLKEKSETAGRLVAGLQEGLNFVDWKVLQEKETEFYIDLVATKGPDGRAVHHVWVVNTEQGTTKPLSQAARDLEDG